MKQFFNLHSAFHKWYTGDAYPDLGSTRKKFFEAHASDTEQNRQFWMEQAFKAGAEAMAKETRCALQDYAAACSGLDPELLCPDEVFDRAEYNLKYFYDKVFTK